MTHLTQRIEDTLASTGYHPDCANDAQAKMDEALLLWNQAKDDAEKNAAKAKAYSLCNDLVLMQGQYFKARLTFLSKVIECVEAHPKPKLDVVDDGCGTGVDLHVLHTLMGDKVSLTGVDIDDSALSVARDRVPSAHFMKDIGHGPAYDLVFSDFMSTGNNTLPELIARGKKTFDILRSPGVVLHNTDAKNILAHCTFFGMQFSKIFQPELLARKDDNDCYLARYEKE